MIPPGFWYGLLAIPVLATGIALASLVVFGVAKVAHLVSAFDWKIWPKERNDNYKRAGMCAVVACAKSVRYFWIPGWHVVVCRTSMFTHGNDSEWRHHARVEHAVIDALGKSVDRT